MRNLALLGLLLAGCHNNGPGDPCSGVGGTCLTVTVKGTASGLDQLLFSIETPSHLTTTTPQPPMDFSLPVRLGLVIPMGAMAPLTITLFGMSKGAAIASDQQTVNFDTGHVSITFDLNTGTAPDLAMPDLQRPDLSKPPITISTSVPDGGVVAYELEHVAFNVTANDPAQDNLTMSLTGAPDGGTVATMPPSLTFDWTPTPFDSADYLLTATATSQTDASRKASLPISMHIKNAADPVFRLNSADTANDNNAHTVVIGDYDGDGFADLASCSVGADPGGSPNAFYSVFIFFADKNGLPSTLPALGAPNYKQISFPGTSPSTPLARLNCIGGDFDGDGKSDVLIADPNAASPQGNLYVLFGVADRTAPGVGIQMLANNAFPAGEKILAGSSLLAGDFNGDGRIDFVTQTFPGGTADNTYVFSWKGQAPINRASPLAQLMTTPMLTAARHPSPTTPSPQPCSTRVVEAMGNIDSAPGEEILLYDPNVNAISISQCGMNGFGGFTVIRDGAADARWVRPMMTAPSFGQSATLCDVDGDGLADLAAVDGNLGVLIDFSGPSGFASTGGTPPVLDGNAGANVTIIPPLSAGRTWVNAGCARKFIAGAAQTLALADPGDNATIPITANLYSNARAPMLVRTIPNPTSPVDLQFASVFGGFGDINGDALNDVVMGSQRGLWAIYGR
jgi:hypothetical protein